MARSTDDGARSRLRPAATADEHPRRCLPNTSFRDGIIESFAASPTYPGHLYLTYEDWERRRQMDVKFTQSTDGGVTWSAPVLVNDNVDARRADRPVPAVGRGRARRSGRGRVLRPAAACPNDPSVLPADVGRTNFCIDVSLQAYKDSGSGAVPVGGNVRISPFTWDPEQPGQHVGGLSQYAMRRPRDPCPTGSGFIGDYFGLAISAGNIYALVGLDPLPIAT